MRCSWVPAKNAPATSAPTMTSATIASASAIPRSFRMTCRIDRSFMCMSVACALLAGGAARVAADRDACDDAVDLVRHARRCRLRDLRRGPAAHVDLDLRDLR